MEKETTNISMYADTKKRANLAIEKGLLRNFSITNLSALIEKSVTEFLNINNIPKFEDCKTNPEED